MKSVPKSLLFFLAYQLLSLSLLAQKHFNLTVNVPQGVNPTKIEAWLENGKENKQLKPSSIANNRLVFSGDYYFLYAAISLQNLPEDKTVSFAYTFFVQEKPAVISFLRSGSSTNVFKTYTLKNALDFKEEKKHLDKHTSEEREKAIDYEKQFFDKIFSSTDTAIKNHYLKVLRPALARKKLQYIISHPQSYYSFYTFRTEVARSTSIPPDSLLSVFILFPERFKYSDEGNYLHEFLYGRLPSEKKSFAVDFTVKDVDQKSVTLSFFQGKKAVLLHFWATWCTPCIRELPALKEISNQYSTKDLQIISIALPSSKYTEFLASTKKYGMDWIHIYDKPDLINKYGNEPTPRLCLIDKTGKVVYDHVGLGESGDVQLNDLKKKLKEVIID